MEATRGPLCILAGAGTGKTTTITRRIAWQVASGAFPPGQIVAVTFTDKAAGELRARLRALGAGRRARLDLPLGGARAAPPLRRGSGPDPPLEGAAPAADRQLAAGGVPLPARRRPRDGDRVGEEPAPHARHVPRLARRPRAADPARPLAAGVPGVRAAQGRRGAARLRGPARAGGAAARRATTACARRCTTAGAPSPSTSTRTSTCSSSRCSISGSATGTTSARSATTTRRSTASRARAPSGCSRCRGASRTLTSCGSSGTTARPRR